MHQITSAQKQIIQTAIVALLLIGCIAVLLPFTGTLMFAVVICVTTAPLRDRLLKLCRGRSHLAALAMVFPVIGTFPFTGRMPTVLVLTLVFGFAIAAVSYALVESPCREALRRWEKRGRPTDVPVIDAEADAIAP